MGGKPLRRARAVLLRGHLAPENRCRARVVAGPRGEAEPDQVGLGLVVARIGERAKRAPDAVGEQVVFTVLVVLRADPERDAAEADQGRLGLALRAVAAAHVRDLVAHHHRDLIVVRPGQLDQAGVDPDLAGGQGEGVDLLRLEDHELPLRVGQVAPHRAGDAFADALDASVHRRIGGDFLLFFDLGEGRHPHLRLLGGGYEDELLAPGLGDGRAAAQQGQNPDDENEQDRERAISHARSLGAPRTAAIPHHTEAVSRSAASTSRPISAARLSPRALPWPVTLTHAASSCT